MRDIQDMVNEVVQGLEIEEEAAIIITVKQDGVEVAYSGMDDAEEQDIEGHRLMVFKADIYTIAVGVHSEGGVDLDA